jgi:hypothetical protein
MEQGLNSKDKKVIDAINPILNMILEKVKQ